MKNLKEKNEQNLTELNKVISVCSNLLKLWAFQILFALIAVCVILAEPTSGVTVLVIGAVVFFVINIFLSLSLFFHGGEGYLIKRQRKILIIVWLVDLFLGFIIIPSIIAKFFFYKGYNELNRLKEAN